MLGAILSVAATAAIADPIADGAAIYDTLYRQQHP